MQTYRKPDIQAYRHTVQTYRRTGIQYGRTDVQTYRHTVQAYRHTGIQAYRHTGIQAYRHTETFLITTPGVWNGRALRSFSASTMKSSIPNAGGCSSVRPELPPDLRRCDVVEPFFL